MQPLGAPSQVSGSSTEILGFLMAMLKWKFVKRNASNSFSTIKRWTIIKFTRMPNGKQRKRSQSSEGFITRIYTTNWTLGMVTEICTDLVKVDTNAHRISNISDALMTSTRYFSYQPTAKIFRADFNGKHCLSFTSTIIADVWSNSICQRYWNRGSNKMNEIGESNRV